MRTMLPYGRRAAAMSVCLLGLGLTGCILPVPTIPLNLPAHGHTYKVRGRDDVPAAGEGILIVRTFYERSYYADRLDCYPIRDGQAAVPFTLDVRVIPREMFGYLSWCIPTYFLLLANADHAQAYPVMPGMAHWDEYGMPCIGSSRLIYGVEPRPQVLRMFPAHAQIELTILKDIEHEMQKYLSLADNGVTTASELSAKDLHNERQARMVLEYVHSRLKALETGPASQPAPATSPSPQP